MPVQCDALLAYSIFVLRVDDNDDDAHSCKVAVHAALFMLQSLKKTMAVDAIESSLVLLHVVNRILFDNVHRTVVVRTRFCLSAASTVPRCRYRHAADAAAAAAIFQDVTGEYGTVDAIRSSRRTTTHVVKRIYLFDHVRGCSQ